MTKIYKSFKVRLYPTKEQEVLFYKHIDACRFLWNYLLDLQEDKFSKGEKKLSGFGMIKLISSIRANPDYIWLNEVSTHSLQVVCRDLDKAYTGYYKHGTNLPGHKSKKTAKKIFPIRAECLYFKNERYLNVEKIGAVKYKTDFVFRFGRGSEKFYKTRIQYTNKKWLLTFTMECDLMQPVLTNDCMGIDLGIKELAVVAFGEQKIVYHNINKSHEMRELEAKRKHVERSLSRKYRQNKDGRKCIKTQNMLREEDKLRQIYAKQANVRKDYINKITHELVSMHPRRVVMENLNVRGMCKNHHLAKSIKEQCFYEFIRQMRYKCEWNGIEFIQADTFYPSSKTCSYCGAINKNLTLKDRTYICPECGAVIDRDYNAAINLSRYMV